MHYPGLPSHPDHETAKRQMKLFSGMIYFELHGGLETGIKMAEVRFIGSASGVVPTLTNEHIPRWRKVIYYQEVQWLIYMYGVNVKKHIISNTLYS